MPGTSSTPGQPVNVTAQADETGALVVQCEAVPLAKRYRWRMLLAGVQTEYQLAARTTEPLAVIAGVAAGQDGADHRAGGEMRGSRGWRASR